MKIELRPLVRVKPYEQRPRINDLAVNEVLVAGP
jgi:hypothetical protein